MLSHDANIPHIMLAYSVATYTFAKHWVKGPLCIIIRDLEGSRVIY